MKKKTKIVLRFIGVSAAAVTVLLVMLFGYFVYITEYRVTEIDSSYSPDGEYALLFQSIGEPDFPYGVAHARLVLQDAGGKIAEYSFDIANDGAALQPENWSTSWETACVVVTVSGSEQGNAVYTLYFNGNTE